MFLSKCVITCSNCYDSFEIDKDKIVNGKTYWSVFLTWKPFSYLGLDKNDENVPAYILWSSFTINNNNN